MDNVPPRGVHSNYLSTGRQYKGCPTFYWLTPCGKLFFERERPLLHYYIRNLHFLLSDSPKVISGHTVRFWNYICSSLKHRGENVFRALFLTSLLSKTFPISITPGIAGNRTAVFYTIPRDR